MGIDHSNPYIHSTTVLCDRACKGQVKDVPENTPHLLVLKDCKTEGVHLLI